MRFLEVPPRYMFFTGKGGVGKTSIACATAVHLADAGARVLLVSTDPASNVGQVFGLAIGNRVTAIADVPGLCALEIDPEEAAEGYRDRIVGPVRGVLPQDVVKGIEEQLSGACTTEIAAFDEFSGLLADSGIASHYDHVVFDTAPTGHTIRLLQLPGAWSGFLEAGKGDASCLGPLAGLQKQRAQYKAAVDALADAGRTRMVLVARAQQSTLAESARTHEELTAIGITRHHLVVNGLFPEAAVQGDTLAASIVRREQAALMAMPGILRMLPRDVITLKPFNVVGLQALRRVLAKDDVSDPVPEQLGHLLDAPSLDPLIDAIAADGHGLVMLMGKGGVGKTTIAAAVAVSLARRGLPVHLTTSDPAAHLTQTLSDAVARLRISRIDPDLETERYRRHVLDTKGRDLDDEGRALLEEDLRSPCTEEIAVFQAFSRIIREARHSFVVMDTAPTGHTLLLLDATGAYHREVTRKLGGSGLHVTTPLMQLQDSKQTKVVIVTLAETTPVLEAAALQADLRRAGIEPWAWVVNQSLAVRPDTSLLLRQRAKSERGRIAEVATQHATRYAVVELQPEDPVGAERLSALTATHAGST